MNTSVQTNVKESLKYILQCINRFKITWLIILIAPTVLYLCIQTIPLVRTLMFTDMIKTTMTGGLPLTMKIAYGCLLFTLLVRAKSLFDFFQTLLKKDPENITTTASPSYFIYLLITALPVIISYFILMTFI